MSEQSKKRKLNPIFLLNDADPSESGKSGAREVRSAPPAVTPVKPPKAAKVVSPFGGAKAPVSPFPGLPGASEGASEGSPEAPVSVSEDALGEALEDAPVEPQRAKRGGFELVDAVNVNKEGGSSVNVNEADDSESSVSVPALQVGDAPVVVPQEDGVAAPVSPFGGSVSAPTPDAQLKNPFLDLPVPAKRQVNPMFQMGGARPKSRETKKVDDVISSGSWDDDPSETSYGLGGEYEEEVSPQYSKGFHLTDRDIIIMRFLARYRYAYRDQLARLVDTTPKKLYGRLRTLEERGFIRKEAVSSRQYLWTTRKAGNELVDIPFKEIRKGSISYATIAHTIGLVNLGVEFEREAGGDDLLGEGKNIIDWVQPENRWKNGLWYSPEGRVKGEMTVTEREIRQGQTRWRGGRSVKQMRDLIQLAIQSGNGVELEEGQEGMFVVYGLKSEGGEHVPDLVIAREPDPVTLQPRHIAVELELTHKTPTEWKRILRNYRDNGMMYDKIYYFTHKRQIANSLKTADAEVGLGDRLVIRKYVPSNPNMPFWG